MLIFWFAVPLISAWGISFFVPVLSYFRILFILPSFYLLLGYGLSKFSRLWLISLLGVIIAAGIFSLSTYYLNPQFQREDWRGAANFIKANTTSKDLVLFEGGSIPAPIIYYQADLQGVRGGLKKIPAKTLADTVDSAILQNTNRIYLYEYLVEIADPQRLLEKRVKQAGFTERDVYNFNGVGLVRLYEKD